MRAHRLQLRRQPDKVRWLQTGVSPDTSVREAAVGSWNFDSGEACIEVLTIHGLDGGQPGLSSTSRWQQQGRVTALEVLPQGSDTAVLITGSSTGQLQAGMHRGEGDQDVQRATLLGSLHDGELRALDVREETSEVITVGEDSRVCAVNLQPSVPASQCLVDTHGSVTFSAVRWTSATEFVTAGTGACLHYWDKRTAHKGQSVARPSPGWSNGVTDWNCIAVHPSRKHLCTVGGSDGAMVMWDLRKPQQPFSLRRPQAEAGRGRQGPGQVWEVQFDRLGQRGGVEAARSEPPVVMCTNGGYLEVVGSGDSVTLVAASFPILTFDMDNDYGRDVLCGVERECLLVGRRTRLPNWEAQSGP